MLVRARDVGRTVEAKFMLTRSAEAFAMMCPTILLRLLKKAARLENFLIVGGFYSEIALRNEKQRAQCILNTS